MGRKKKPIVRDEFSVLKISEQAKIYKRRKRDGLCRSCSSQRLPDSDKCKHHLVMARIQRRVASGWSERRAKQTRKLKPYRPRKKK